MPRAEKASVPRRRSSANGLTTSRPPRGRGWKTSPSGVTTERRPRARRSPSPIGSTWPTPGRHRIQAPAQGAIYQPVVDRSTGSTLWDIDGNQYIDVLNGLAARCSATCRTSFGRPATASSTPALRSDRCTRWPGGLGAALRVDRTRPRRGVQHWFRSRRRDAHGPDGDRTQPHHRLSGVTTASTTR